MLILKASLAWLVILVLAVANGALREALLIPSLGKSGAFVSSGLILSLLIVLAAYVFVRSRPGLTAAQGLHVGLTWLVLTLAFEFGFGRYAQHKSWAELRDAYTFQDGNIWPIVLLVTLLSPAIVALLRSRHA